MTGVLEIAAAIRLRRVIAGEWMLALSGLLSCAFGLIVLAIPAAGAVAIAWTLGAYAVASGVVLTALSGHDAETVVRTRRRRIDAQGIVQRRFGAVLLARHHVHGADVDDWQRVRRVERSSALERRERLLHASGRRERDSVGEGGFQSLNRWCV